MMKYAVCLLLSFLVLSCGKDVPTIDGTDQFSFNTSLEEVVESIPSLQRNRLRQAVELLYQYDTQPIGDRWVQLRKSLDGTNANDIFSRAEAVAKANGLDWNRNKTASLSDFAEKPDTIKPLDEPVEKVESPIPNAASISLQTKNMEDRVVLFPSVLRENGTLIRFNKVVPALVEVKNEKGEVIYSQRDEIESYRDSNEELGGDGISVLLGNLNGDKIPSQKLLFSVKVNDPNQYLKASSQIQVAEKWVTKVIDTPKPENDSLQQVEEEAMPESKNLGEVVTTTIVNRFLQNWKRNNLSAAYALTKNPKWSSYQSFSGSETGLGKIKVLNIKKVSFIGSEGNTAKVNAFFDGKQEETSFEMKTVYTLKKSGEKWFIVDAKTSKVKEFDSPTPAAN